MSEDMILAAEKPPKTARAHCWTLNNHTPSEVEAIKKFASDHTAYTIFQTEIAPVTKTPHLQGYSEYKGPLGKPAAVAWNIIKTKTGIQRFHLEKRGGTPQEAADYCKKLDSRAQGSDYIFFEHGQRSGGQGKRSDLAEVQVALDGGMRMKELSDKHFNSFVRHHKSFTLYRELHTKKRVDHTICICLYGATSCGKTQLALDLFADSYWPNKGNTGTWYDDYDQQEAVVFDEFSGWIPFTTFKRLIDRSPMQLDSKGGKHEFNSRFVVFISNNPPTEWYDCLKTVDDDAAFKRRLHIILKAKVVTNLVGDESVRLIVEKFSLPWGANLRPDTALPGLTSGETRDLVKYGLEANRYKTLHEKCDWTRGSRSSQGSRSGGVILYPPQNHEKDFYDAALHVLQPLIALSDVASGGSPLEAGQSALPSTLPSQPKILPAEKPGLWETPVSDDDLDERNARMDREMLAAEWEEANIHGGAKPQDFAPDTNVRHFLEKPKNNLSHDKRDRHSTGDSSGAASSSDPSSYPRVLGNKPSRLSRQNAFRAADLPAGHLDEPVGNFVPAPLPVDLDDEEEQQPVKRRGRKLGTTQRRSTARKYPRRSRFILDEAECDEDDSHTSLVDWSDDL